MDTPDNTTWRKSTYSGGGSGGTECVEAGSTPGAVLLRDTANRPSDPLSFTAAAWTTFIRNVK